MKKSSVFSVFKTEAEDASVSPQKGFSFGGRWFCSKDCLKWAMGEEIGHLFYHSSSHACLSRARLGTILRAKDLISKEQLQEALDKQEREGGKLGEWLIRLAFLSEDELITCLAEQLKVPWIQDLDHASNDRALEALPAYLCRQFSLMPLEFHPKGRLAVAVDYTFDNQTIQMIGDVLECGVRVFLAKSDKLRQLIQQRYGPVAEREVETIPLGSDPSLSVGHCFVEKWFDVGARKARFGLLDDLLWIRYEKDGDFFDHLVRLAGELHEGSEVASQLHSYQSQLDLFQ